MADLSSLAPLIFGGVFAIGGAFSLWWMNTHAPQFHVPAPPEEVVPDPFDHVEGGKVLVTVQKKHGRRAGVLEILPRELVASTVFGAPRKAEEKQKA